MEEPGRDQAAREADWRVAEFVASLALVWLAAEIFAHFELMIVVTFMLGVAVQAAQAGLNVLAAMYYPTVIRSTGVGWALGVGRIGAIVGPLIGGAMLEMQWTPREIFLAGAIPALQHSGGSLSAALNEGGRGGTMGRGGRFMRNALVIAEVALAVVVLIVVCLSAFAVWVGNMLAAGRRPSGSHPGGRV